MRSQDSIFSFFEDQVQMGIQICQRLQGLDSTVALQEKKISEVIEKLTSYK